MIHIVIIRTFLTLALALQTLSPEASQHWDAARRAENEKHFDVASAEYRKVTELELSFAAGFVSLGQSLMEQRDYGAAIAPLKRALELDSTLAPAHQLLGYALLAQGYPAEAIPHLDRVHEQAALGIAQLEAGQLAQSIPNLQAAREKRPNDPDLLYYLGRASGCFRSNPLTLCSPPILIQRARIKHWQKIISSCGKCLKPRSSTNKLCNCAPILPTFTLNSVRSTP